MGVVLAAIGYAENMILAGVFAANLVLALRAWRNAERKIERVGVVMAGIGTTVLLLFVLCSSGG